MKIKKTNFRIYYKIKEDGSWFPLFSPPSFMTVADAESYWETNRDLYKKERFSGIAIMKNYIIEPEFRKELK
mgnify:CR=1 FL=1